MLKFDIAIIGGGAAGMSAAVNARARNKSVIVLTGAGMESSALYKAESVNNYIGIQSNGQEMLSAFYKHAENTGAEIRKGRVLQIMAMSGYFALQVEQSMIETKAVILATGISKKSSIKGEPDFVGKGVSYCATCDGMLYRGKKAVVIAEIEEGDEEANFLSEICSSVLYFPKHTPTLENLKSNIQIAEGKVTEIKGGETVTSVILDNGEEIECGGVFIIKEAAPLNSLIYGLNIDKSNAIAADKNMRTNIAGVFACGDCTGAPYQVAKAASEGMIAGQQAAKYVSEMS